MGDIIISRLVRMRARTEMARAMRASGLEVLASLARARLAGNDAARDLKGRQAGPLDNFLRATAEHVDERFARQVELANREADVDQIGIKAVDGVPDDRALLVGPTGSAVVIKNIGEEAGDG